MNDSRQDIFPFLIERAPHKFRRDRQQHDRHDGEKYPVGEVKVELGGDERRIVFGLYR